MDDKVEEVMALSDDGDYADCDDGAVSPTPATVPKKRGRPAKKSPGGRPPKGTDVGGTGSEDGSPIPNGDNGEVVTSKRGRPKRKHPKVIEASGKGRGRPKKMVKSKLGDEDNDEAADDNDGASSDSKTGKKVNAKAGNKGRGRPKKVQNSDEENSDDKVDDEVVRRPVGRPSSGGISLNIVRTGKGQGRPKKKLAGKRAADDKIDSGDVKKPGRPSTSGKGAYTPTGKPRGRPKAQKKDSEDEDEELPKMVAEHSSDDGDEDEKANTDSENVD